MAPTVFVASRPPDPSPAWAASSASSADEAGNATPSAIVTGRTTRTDDPTRAMSVSMRLAGRRDVRRDEDERRAPTSASAAAIDLAGGEEPERVAEPGPEDREEHGPQGDPDQEGGQDGREHVGRVAGPRGEQPRPGHLVAERGETRDEGDSRARGAARLGAGAIGRPDGGGRRSAVVATARRSVRSPSRAAPNGRARGPTSPATTEQPAPTASAPDRPSSSMRTNPASVVPMIAPIVLAAYSRLKAPVSVTPRARYRVSVGSVAPIRIVAGARASTAIANRQDRQRAGRPSSARVDVAVEAVDEPERERRDDDHERQRELEEAVHPERVADPVGDTPADVAADGDAAEEAGEDGRHGLGRVAEDEHELARPDDLVDQRRRAGQDEDGEDDRAAPGSVGHVAGTMVGAGGAWRRAGSGPGGRRRPGSPAR